MKKRVILLAMMAILISGTTYASGSKPPPDPQKVSKPWYEVFKGWF